MAKKDDEKDAKEVPEVQDATEEPEGTPGYDEPAVLAEEAPEIPEEYKQYHVGNWHGRFPVYKCPHCPWDTMVPTDMDTHISGKHPTAWMAQFEEEG